jgi:SAM-dependent methyltransferase
LSSSDSAQFTCNLCGAECARPAKGLAREEPTCEACGSTVRLRALVALLSREIFGIAMPLPDFPVMKSIRGIGMSDAPALAVRLAEKFDYTNTFYHQAPIFNVTSFDSRDQARYDFILTSEVMEHVPAPIGRAFETLCRMLKPDALLLMTTPYRLEGKTAEHFPELGEYALAAPGGRTVLVNRRNNGSFEVFENLVFHGGGGSTLEMRVFTEPSLRALLGQAGFESVHIATEDTPEFGIELAQSWSLPIAARKGCFRPSTVEISRAYLEVRRQVLQLEQQLALVQADYERHVRFHTESHEESQQELKRRTEWARNYERELGERTQWAKELAQSIDDLKRRKDDLKRKKDDLQAAAKSLSQQLKQTRYALTRLERQFWTRLGRKVGLIK